MCKTVGRIPTFNPLIFSFLVLCFFFLFSLLPDLSQSESPPAAAEIDAPAFLFITRNQNHSGKFLGELMPRSGITPLWIITYAPLWP